MDEYVVENFKEFHDVLSKYRKSNLWLFRGHKKTEWDLVPKSGREIFNECNDKTYFEAWKRRAKKFVEVQPKNDWDWLSIAQHHGLATRLLDWTINPMTAAFFSIRDNDGNDSVIYCYHYSYMINPDLTSPFECKDIKIFRPNGISQRIVRQGGIFTIHNPPSLNLKNNLKEDNILERIILRDNFTKELKFILNQYGINIFSLFPNLDGLSEYVNWFMKNRDYWGYIDATNINFNEI